MEFVLLILIVFSLAAAAGFAAVAWRLQREDRRRSAARVAVLSAALDGHQARTDVSVGTNLMGADLKVGLYDATASDGEEGQPAKAAVGADLQVGPLQVGQRRSMFDMTPGGSVKGRPMLKAAVVGVMGIIVIVAAAMGNDGSSASSRAALALPSNAPLELMSMRHTLDKSTLTVTGLVRNPKAGQQARRVAAVVFAFDRTGAFVASGRAPLDFVVLEPDDESPFVVTIPNIKDVARYRVSFRTDDGVVRHVDRRAEQLQLAGNH
jgi:hypothetical protein